MELGVTAVMLPELDFDEQIDLCCELGIKYYQYRPRVIPPERKSRPYHSHGNHKFDLTPDGLVKKGADLTARLRQAGMEPWGTLPSLTVDASDDQMKRDFEGALKADARCVRCAPPPYPDEPFDYDELLDRTVARYAYIIESISGPMGVKLLIETHTRSLACAPGLAWNLVRHFPPERIGVIFDMANFGNEGAIYPVLAVSVLRDYIDCVHIGASRRMTQDHDELGCKRVTQESCPIEEGDLHAPKWLAVLRDAGLDPPLIIEDFDLSLTGAQRLTRCAATMHRILEAM
jgi:sugar phosphate isomerase/epimerase